jgi:diadenosine tetraphosphate (Ap4A) HIT family hydrolase
MSSNLTIKEYSNWILAYAAFPYRKYHTLVIAKRHILKMSDLTAEELKELTTIADEIENLYVTTGIVGPDSEFGSQTQFTWRSRSNLVEKKSVSHIHVHAYPEFAKDPGIPLDDQAWDIDMSRLTLL